MKRTALLFAAVLSATDALAQGPSTSAMTCGEAGGIVASQGAVVLSTGPHTYDRYVSGQNFCTFDEVTEPVWVPTADASQCFVGYRCRSGPRRLFNRTRERARDPKIIPSRPTTR